MICNADGSSGVTREAKMMSNREAAAVADRQRVHRQHCTSIRAVNCLKFLRKKKKDYSIVKKRSQGREKKGSRCTVRGQRTEVS